MSTLSGARAHAPARGWARELDGRIALALGILAVGAFLRVFRIADAPLWGDEANTLFRVRLPFGEMLYTLAYFDTHPPLTYTLLKPWMAAFGESETALRGFAAFWGLLMLPLAWWAGRDLAGRALGGWIVVLLVTTHPVLVFYSREGRSYSLLAFMALASFCALRLALREQKPWQWALYSVATAASLYTHNLAFLWLAWQAAMVMASALHARSSRVIRGFAVAQAGAYALYLPWMVFFLTQFVSLAGQGGSWLPPVEPRMVVVSLLNYLGAASYLRLGDMRPSLDWLTFLLLVGPALLLYGGLRGLQPPGRWQACALAALPIPVLALAAAVVSVYVDRGLIAAAVGVSLVPAGLAALTPSRLTRLVMGLALLATLTLHTRGFVTYLDRPADDFRGVAADLRAATRPGDTVLFLPWFGSDATRYYWDQAPGSARWLMTATQVDPPGGITADDLRGGAVWIVRVPAPPPPATLDLPARLEAAGLRRAGIRYYPDRLLTVELFTPDWPDTRGLAWRQEPAFIAPQP